MIERRAANSRGWEGDGPRRRQPAAAGAEAPRLIAYRVSRMSPLRLVPAPRSRDWMESTGAQSFQRCLPLLIANQAGWLILNSYPIRATWTGGAAIASLRVETPPAGDGVCPYEPEPGMGAAVSHFGHGILTFQIPYLFRTPPGYNLLVRGPSNWPRDGAAPLEGVVETDWSQATFTMNWQLTRPGLTVTFAAGEPICMLVPQRRGEPESFWPEIREAEDESEVGRGFRAWAQSRAQFLAGQQQPGSEAVRAGWQRHYFHGSSPGGASAPEHQVKLKLREFDRSPRPEAGEAEGQR
jgi:hypothetical protein